MKISTCSHRPVLVPCRLENRDYQVDPYIGCEHYCHYCYALNQAETDWDKEILIHKDIAGQLRKGLKKISPQKLYMGYYTDPYQPCEAEYRQTRKALEVFLEKGFSTSILTKSDLIVRDTELLKKMDNASVSVSIAFNDNRIRQQFEAKPINTEARIEALSKLRKAGIKTSALICPVIPYITDVKPLIDMLAPLTDVIWIYGLSIEKRSDQNWQNVEVILKTQFPDLKEQIDEVIFSKDHRYWTQLRQDLLDIQRDRQLNLNIHI
ncbi:MAG: radical SAM protein [Desulfobacteraceae bacterium]|nr:radical SAM protein [Desulfobacteraceae bacterium]